MPKLTDEQIVKAYDILDRFDFFNQRAGRELWNDKPKDIQDTDIKNFSSDVEFLKDLINRLKAENLQLNSDFIILENNYEHLKQNFDETVEKNKRLRMKLVYAVNTIADLKRLLKKG